MRAGLGIEAVFVGVFDLRAQPVNSIGNTIAKGKKEKKFEKKKVFFIGIKATQNASA